MNLPKSSCRLLYTKETSKAIKSSIKTSLRKGDFSTMDVNNSTGANGTFYSYTSPVATVNHTELAVFSILIVWSLLGNILVIAVVYRNQNLRTNMNYLIVNMAVSDLLIPLIAVPLWLSWSYLEIQWLAGDALSNALCKLASFLAEISPLVSSISLVIIAFQRFFAVTYPLTRRQILTRKTRWTLIFCPWLAATALCSPLLYTTRVVPDKEWGGSLCISSWLASLITFCVSLAFGFVIPLFITIILYTIILYNLSTSLKSVMGKLEKDAIRRRQRRNKQIFSMSITMIGVFTICWFPYSLVALSFYTEHSSWWSLDVQTQYTLNFAVTSMWYSLAAINPCIYFLFLKDFRQGLCCRKIAVVVPRNEVRISRRQRTVGGDSNQGLTRMSLQLNITSVV